MCRLGLLKLGEFFLKSNSDRKLTRKERKKVIYFLVIRAGAFWHIVYVLAVFI